MIKAVIFDLGEVLLDGLLGTEHKLEAQLDRNHKDIHKGFHIEELTRFFEGKISEEEYWDFVIKKNGWDVTKDVLKLAVRNNFKEIEGTRTIIEQLRKKGYKLGLLSNHAKEWIVFCEEKFDFEKLFDEVLYSFEIKAIKPDKRGYISLLKSLNVKPEECLFIDDSQVYVESAKKLGINTIQFQNPKQLKKELASFSIKLD